MKFDISKEAQDIYLNGVKALLQKHKISNAAIMDLSNLVVTNLTKQLDKEDIYLPCNDGTGNIYNRKTGDRFSITKVENVKSGGDKKPYKAKGRMSQQ